MEMPIRIMVVLFVAIVVGSMMILFARNIIRDRPDIFQQTETPDEDKIIKFPELTSDRVVELAKQCYEDNRGEATDRTLCFVTQGDTSTIVIDDILNDLWVAYPKLEVIIPDNVMDGDYSLSIYYNPMGVENTLEIMRS